MGPVAETPRPCPGLPRVRVATTPPTIGLVVNDEEPSASSLGATYSAESPQRLMALKKLGDSVTADHLFSHAPQREERSGGACAMATWGWGARWGDCFPSAEDVPLTRDYPYASSGQPRRPRQGVV